MPAPWLTSITTVSALAFAPLALVAGGDYIVRPGDTAGAIAAAHDIALDALVDANDLPEGGDLVYAGESLTIPSAHDRPNRSASSPRPGPDARRTVWHTVKLGDTVTELAVRYHAWTDELITVNRLGGDATLDVGQRLAIPVVLAALPQRHIDARHTQPAPRHATARLSNPSRAHVRAVIASTARRYGVHPSLALAISWQEAGWQQDHVSSAGAIGAMQVMPPTGAWIETILGRDLDLRDVGDNATAGVVLLRELTGSARQRRAIAGYYQGLASVRERGMYADTRSYVANVLAIKRSIRAGSGPL